MDRDTSYNLSRMLEDIREHAGALLRALVISVIMTAGAVLALIIPFPSDEGNLVAIALMALSGMGLILCTGCLVIIVRRLDAVLCLRSRENAIRGAELLGTGK
jgi:hypothetical protein